MNAASVIVILLVGGVGGYLLFRYNRVIDIGERISSGCIREEEKKMLCDL